MGQATHSWSSHDRRKVYAELDHPADLFLSITGQDLSALLENALFALYDQMATLDGFAAHRELTIGVREASSAEALRALLAEALYRFETEGFVATGAEIDVDTNVGPTDEEEDGKSGAADTPGGVGVTARLWGEDADKRRHALLTEVKAVTYHRLSATRAPDGTWQATVLLDI